MEDLQCKYADITVMPSRLDFVVTEGWQFVPPYQYLVLNKATTGRAAQWEISADAEWLMALHGSGRVPARVRIGCASIGMELGVYRGMLTIKSHVNVDRPQIPVSLTVKPAVEPEPPPPEPEPEPEPPPPEPPPEPPPPPPEPPPPPPEPPPPPPPPHHCWLCQIIGKLGKAMRRH